MDRAAYDSLTPMERACLRLSHHEQKAENVAEKLKIKVSTVNAHVFNARRKLGGISRLSAADRLRAFEKAIDLEEAAPTGPQPQDLAPSHVVEPPLLETGPVENQPSSETETTLQPVSSQTLWMERETGPPSQMRHPADVREHRATFVFDHDVGETSGGQDQSFDEGLRRFRLILAIAALAALVAIAAPAIYDSAAERIANSLERPHHR